VAWSIDQVGHLAHVVQGRRVWSRAWRGTRIPAWLLLEAAERSGARAELRPRAPSCGRVVDATCGCCCAGRRRAAERAQLAAEPHSQADTQ
jgi:hypothetical protein